MRPPQTNATLVAVYPVSKAAEWNSARSEGDARWTGKERFYIRQTTTRESKGTSEDSASNRNIKFMSEVTKKREAFLEQARKSVKPQENEVIGFVLDGEDQVQTARVLAVEVFHNGHISSTRNLQLQPL